MESTLAVRKLMMFAFQEVQKEKKESKRRASLSGASFDEVSLFLCLALLAISAFPSLFIKLLWYHFDKILSRKTFSPDHSRNCDNRMGALKTIEKGNLI